MSKRYLSKEGVPVILFLVSLMTVILVIATSDVSEQSAMARIRSRPTCDIIPCPPPFPCHLPPCGDVGFAAPGTTSTPLGMATTHLSQAIKDVQANNTKAALSELQLVNSSLTAHVKELQNMNATTTSGSNMTGGSATNNSTSSK
jgi:hypothetical protein